VEVMELLETGDRMGVGGTLGLSWSHCLKCCKIEHDFLLLTQVSQEYHKPLLD
jgi:hypothetical protein